MFFVIAIAVIVVSIGSGVYFMSRPKAALAPSKTVVLQENSVAPIATGTEPIVVSSDAAATATLLIKSAGAPKIARAKPVDCGVGAAANACMFKNVAACSAAKGTLIDESTGVRVEHIVDGLVNGKCLYQSTITFAPGEYAMLEGLDVRCDLPKDQLLRVLQAPDEDQLLRACTGSYVDILRQARGMAPAAQ